MAWEICWWSWLASRSLLGVPEPREATGRLSNAFDKGPSSCLASGMRIGKNMKDALGFAKKYPGWHTYGTGRGTAEAIKCLERLGLIKTNKFRQFHAIDKPTSKRLGKSMAKQLTNDQHKQINWMDRSEIVGLLESVGIQCYDSESTADLKSELINNVLDGTIELPE